MKRILTRIFYYLGLFIAGLIILACIVLYSLPLTTPYLQKHRQDLEKLVSHLIHYQVKVGAIRSERSGINPEFQFHNVTIYDPSGTHRIAKFDDLYIGISLIDSMFNRHLTASFLLLSGAKLDLYQHKSFDLHTEKEAVLFTPKHVYLQNVYIKWHEKNGKVIVCPDLTLQVIKDLAGRKIVAMGDLFRHQTTTKFKLIARLHGHDLEFKKIVANGYIKLVEENKANIEAWFDWENQQVQKLQSQFSVHNINLRPTLHSKIIYLNSLTGNILLQQQYNGWSLSGNYTNIIGDYGKLFRQSLKIDKLQGVVNWEHTPDGWQIDAHNIMAQNADLNLAGDANILLPNGNASPVLAALGTIKLKNVNNARLYYPASIMAKDLLTWLDSSIKNAKAISGTFIWRGKLADFPFRDYKGRFLASANIADANIKFDPDWSMISDINGTMLFDNDAMQINATGNMLNMALNDIQVVIPELNKPVLSASGKFEGDNADLLNLINHSPLQEDIGRYTKEMQVTGPMTGQLKFTLPLGDTPGQTTTNGKIVETDGILQIPAWQMNLTKLAGNIYFTENSLSSENLTASFLDNPVKIKMATLGDLVRIGMNGECTVSALQKNFSSPLLKGLSGGFNYRTRLDLYKNSKHDNDFNIMSNLDGLKITLPKPFGKSENELRDVYARAIFSANKPIQVKIRYNDYLSAALKFSKATPQGEIHIGDGLATLPTKPGLFITGSLPEARWSDWQPYLIGSTGKEKTIINNFDVTIGNLYAFHQDWSNTRLQAQPKAESWFVQVTNDKVIGQLTVPDLFPKQALVGKFNKLYLTFDNKQKPLALRPTDVPPLDIITNDFRYNNKQFGHIELKVTRHNSSLRINKLNINSPDFNLSSTGNWRLYNGAQHSALYGTLQTNDAGALLKSWNNTQDLNGGQGTMTFSLHWLGTIYDLNLPSMYGNLLLDLKHGRIINIGKETEQKVDMGRALNILNPMSLADKKVLFLKK